MENKSCYIGVDVGKKGVIAKLYQDNTIEVFKIPLLPNERLDIGKFLEIIKGDNVSIAIEKQFLKREQGHSFTIGRNYGELYALSHINLKTSSSLNSVVEVQPITWQKAFALAPRGVKKTKLHHINYVLNLYPQLKGVFLDKRGRIVKSRHDYADAVLIATWLKKRLITLKKSK